MEAEEPKTGSFAEKEPIKNEGENAFAYLDRDHFTSEKFKIEIRNLPKNYGMPELKKLLNKKLSLDVNKVKRPHIRSSWIYVCFRSEEAREAGLKILNGYIWKGNTLSANRASAVPDPLVLKRKTEDESGDGGKKFKLETMEDMVTRLKDATAPLWRRSYEEQLQLKTEKVKSLLRRLAEDLVYGNPNLEEWMKSQQTKFDGLPCELLPIKPSPEVNGYRNKCEFTIGINELTGEKTIGMRLSSYAKGSLCVVSPAELPHVPEPMKKACAVSEIFIRASSLDVYNQENHEGHWKSLTARYGFRTKQLMLMFIVRPDNLKETDVAGLVESLRTFFTNGAGAALGVSSLLLALAGKTREKPTVRCVLGEPFIYEEVCGRKFRISPNAFFQINSPGAEVLFNTIGELIDADEDTSFVDICCGAGTIAICLSKSCGEVLGLEKWAESVEDAKKNAEINGLENARFFAGGAEEILGAVLHQATKKKVVAVVDPPRAGLESRAIKQLRTTTKLEQFVYASCNPNLALKNFVSLGRSPSKQYPNEPYVPVRCVPVDMFPHTEGCELVLFFKRLSLVTGSGDAVAEP